MEAAVNNVFLYTSFIFNISAQSTVATNRRSIIPILMNLFKSAQLNAKKNIMPETTNPIPNTSKNKSKNRFQSLVFT
ncbi:hypothetical protein D3C87_2001790 [compost metagenome]